MHKVAGGFLIQRAAVITLSIFIKIRTTHNRHHIARLFGAKPLPEPMMTYCQLVPLGTTFSEIWIEIQNFSLMQMHLIMSSAKGIKGKEYVVSGGYCCCCTWVIIYRPHLYFLFILFVPKGNLNIFHTTINLFYQFVLYIYLSWNITRHMVL